MSAETKRSGETTILISQDRTWHVDFPFFNVRGSDGNLKTYLVTEIVSKKAKFSISVTSPYSKYVEEYQPLNGGASLEKISEELKRLAIYFARDSRPNQYSLTEKIATVGVGVGAIGSFTALTDYVALWASAAFILLSSVVCLAASNICRNTVAFPRQLKESIEIDTEQMVLLAKEIQNRMLSNG